MRPVVDGFCSVATGFRGKCTQQAGSVILKVRSIELKFEAFLSLV